MHNKIHASPFLNKRGDLWAIVRGGGEGCRWFNPSNCATSKEKVYALIFVKRAGHVKERWESGSWKIRSFMGDLKREIEKEMLIV